MGQWGGRPPVVAFRRGRAALRSRSRPSGYRRLPMPERSSRPPTERRAVRSEGPSLSPEANRLLTEELRAVVGRDDVEVAADAPRRSDERHGTHSRFVAALLSHRQILLVTLLAAIVVGGIVSLSTGAYWAVLVAVGLHAFGTMVVVA